MRKTTVFLTPKLGSGFRVREQDEDEVVRWISQCGVSPSWKQLHPKVMNTELCLPLASQFPSLPRRLWGIFHGGLLLPILWWGHDLLTLSAWGLVLLLAVLTGACALWTSRSPIGLKRSAKP